MELCRLAPKGCGQKTGHLSGTLPPNGGEACGIVVAKGNQMSPRLGEARAPAPHHQEQREVLQLANDLLAADVFHEEQGRARPEREAEVLVLACLLVEEGRADPM